MKFWQSVFLIMILACCVFITISYHEDNFLEFLIWGILLIINGISFVLNGLE